ncbi:hypothetical protein FHS85_003570 [Rhodoligotrophos appendicifer]|uniref:alpha/beta hydrolase n=1 Tax=Rhodoligotrophos appendicifer TaxID=987056 RepID=UPI001185076F|nr:hypothetical protein [Rhodoligotrophos appendicifer]
MAGDALLRIIRGPLGPFIARPWFDELALLALKRWFLPASRQWAVANATGTDLSAFLSTLGAGEITRGRSEIDRLLHDVKEARARRFDAEVRWEAHFFGHERAPPGILATYENERLERARAHTALFRRFGGFRYKRPLESATWRIPTPEQAEMISGPEELDPAVVYSFPPEDIIRQSVALDDAGGRQFWIRFRSPYAVVGDRVTAWVYEPRGIANPPTLIFGHGLGMDFDHWPGMKADTSIFTKAGIRVIRPEAPWHGRRVPLGHYSGEVFAATLPLGAVHGLAGSVLEWSVLMRWARATSSGPVAVGGISLGALTAQLLAAKARYWPREYWPDALLLINHCASIWHILAKGRLPDAWKSRDRLTKAGWNRVTIAPYLPLMDPWEETVVPAQAMVTLNGRYDNVTPYGSAELLLRHWQVPEENRFLWPGGHFSVPLGLIRDQRPLIRFSQILKGL